MRFQWGSPVGVLKGLYYFRYECNGKANLPIVIICLKKDTILRESGEYMRYILILSFSQ